MKGKDAAVELATHISDRTIYKYNRQPLSAIHRIGILS